MKCFTDGSKKEEKTGFAFIIDKDEFTFRLPNNTSIFTAESLAVFLCIQKIIDKNIQKAVIFTDAKSVVSGLQNYDTTHKNYFARYIKEELYKASMKNIKIIIVWIPNHSSIGQNDRVDFLAKSTYNSQLYDFQFSSDIKAYLKNQILKNNLQSWLNTTSNHLRSFKDNNTLWKTSLRKNRMEEIVISRLRVGVTRITHSYVINKEF